MNNKNIEQLIPKAIEKLSSFNKKKVHQSYLASFGPSVIFSGIVRTVTIYGDKSDSNKDRRAILKIMFSLINEDIDSFIANEKSNSNYSLKNKILEASVACKLAIRTFELKD
jgi:hypothetical protein